MQKYTQEELNELPLAPEEAEVMEMIARDDRIARVKVAALLIGFGSIVYVILSVLSGITPFR